MNKLFPSYVRVPLLFLIAFGAMQYLADSGNTLAILKYPMLGVFLVVFLFLLIAIEMTVSAIDNIMYQIMTPEQKKVIDDSNAIAITDSEWYKNLIKKLTKSEPIENEGLLLLDHDYDGIKELNNNLPPWWVYLFYGTIAFAAIYLIRFEILDGDNQEMELKKEMAQAKIDVAEYLKTAPDLMDESKVTQLTDPNDLVLGKNIFMQNCTPCHRADAGGQIGPNLTDEHWILGGGIKNIFHTLEHGGRDGKGMVSWKGTLKPKEMQLVASYVMSLKGSNPKDPKAPDGDIWVDPNEKTASSTISTAQAK